MIAKRTFEDHEGGADLTASPCRVKLKILLDTGWIVLLSF
jgi:hypothetical protein